MAVPINGSAFATYNTAVGLQKDPVTLTFFTQVNNKYSTSK